MSQQKQTLIKRAKRRMILDKIIEKEDLKELKQAIRRKPGKIDPDFWIFPRLARS